MKTLAKNLVVKYLAWLARRVIHKNKPIVIGITGSYGKTSTKEAIFASLSAAFPGQVDKTAKNLNSEYGLPLAILGFKTAPHGLAWILYLKFAALKSTYHKLKKYFVAELSADKPSDITHLLTIVSPKIAVVTGITSVHLEKEQFKDLEDIAKEKGKIVKVLPKDGTAIFNGDDLRAFKMKEFTEASVISYGFDEKCMVRAENYQIKDFKSRFNLKVSIPYLKQKFERQIAQETLGRHLISSSLAAVAVGLSLNADIDKIIKSIESIKPQLGRMNIIEGQNKTVIIDDTYNANPASVAAALLALKEIDSGRRVAILGNMNELGNFSEAEHKKIGELAHRCADLLVAIGERGKWIAEAAKDAGMGSIKVITFDTPEEAIDNTPKLIHEGDIILVKGSQNNVRLERVVKVLMKHPEQAQDLLVRQEKWWG